MEQGLRVLLADDSICLIDAADAHHLGNFTWTVCPSGYVKRRYGGAMIYLHRIILDAPKGALVDHANGDRRDNRRANLRVCTAEQNSQNSRLAANNSTGFKGVSSRGPNRWTARIRHQNQVTHLGTFDDPRIAAHAYNTAAVRLFGEFASLNPL